MKKGLLFSLMTFLLIFSLLLFGQAILKRDSASSSTRTMINSGAKISTIESFIASDILSTLNLSYPHLNRSTQIIIYFDNFGELPMKESSLQKYLDFIASNYSMREKINVSVSGPPNLTIQPINSTIFFFGNETIIYTTNYTLIRSISLEILVNTTSVVNSSTPSADTLNQTITIVITDKNGLQAYSNSAMLNPNEANPPFSVFFNSSVNSSVIVQFGVINGRNGTFLIRANNLRAIPQDLKIAIDLIPEEAKIGLNSTIRYFDESTQTQKNSSITIRRA